jgi:esterase
MILYSKLYGQGNPVVILHGLFGSSDNWQTFAKSLAPYFQVITLDIRNHGKSGHSDEFNYTVIAEDLVETLDLLRVDKFHLVGHSMGGKAAAYFALKYPSRMISLTLLDIALRSYPPHHGIYFDAMFALDLDKIESRKDAEETLGVWIQDMAIKQFLLKNLSRNEQNKLAWKFNLKALYENYDEINVPISSQEECAKPCLVVRGELSSYVREEDESAFLKQFPNSKFITIPEAGHWIHADQPEALKEVLMEFWWSI